MMRGRIAGSLCCFLIYQTVAVSSVAVGQEIEVEPPRPVGASVSVPGYRMVSESGVPEITASQRQRRQQDADLRVRLDFSKTGLTKLTNATVLVAFPTDGLQDSFAVPDNGQIVLTRPDGVAISAGTIDYTILLRGDVELVHEDNPGLKVRLADVKLSFQGAIQVGPTDEKRAGNDDLMSERFDRKLLEQMVAAVLESDRDRGPCAGDVRRDAARLIDVTEEFFRVDRTENNGRQLAIAFQRACLDGLADPQARRNWSEALEVILLAAIEHSDGQPERVATMLQREFVAVLDAFENGACGLGTGDEEHVEQVVTQIVNDGIEPADRIETARRMLRDQKSLDALERTRQRIFGTAR